MAASFFKIKPTISESIESYFNSTNGKVNTPEKFKANIIAIRFLILLIVLVSLGNYLFHIYIDWLEIHGTTLETILGVCTLLLILFPLFYFLLFKPLNEQIEVRQSLLESLKSSEFNFLTMVRSSPDLILISRKSDGKIVYANMGSEKILGYKKHEMVGKTSEELKLFSPLQRINFLEKLKKTGQVVSTELDLKHKDGFLKHFLISASEIKIKNSIHLFVNAKDITEIKEKQTELLKLYKAIESSPVSVFITNINGVIEYANKKTSEVTGYSNKEIIGNTPKIFKSGKHNLKFYKSLWTTILSGENWVSEIQNKKKNGELFWEMEYISPIKNENGEITNFVAVRENITERKLMLEDLLVAKDKAEESNQLKTEFINNMSHEIRTPLNGILGFSDFLNNPDLSQPKRQQYIHIIQQSSKQLMHIIDDILEISMLGTKKVMINESIVNINDLLMELYQVFNIKAKEKELPFYFKKSLLDKNAMLRTDKVKVNKIISNLLENALKFTQQGFIELGYSINEKNKNAPRLEIYVKDTGIGIAKNKQQAIFERFAQAEKELSKKVGGLGLGLSIAKENTELLGGTLSVNSELEKGTTFIVSIPYKQANNELIIKSEVPKFSIKEICTILIAEDEEFNYIYLETLLNDVLNLDCNLIHAKNGKEAVEFAAENSNISMVLMDLKMPVMTGFEATTLIKEANPNLPIIAQSAYSTKIDIEKAYSAGCNDFISKPINTEEFKEILTKYIKVDF